MAAVTTNGRLSGVRLWCVIAAEAPIVGVIARCYGERQWTGILKWNYEAGRVEEGAWTTMRIAAHRCCLSPDGYYLHYHATGPTHGPFNGFYGGAFSISHLPWLSALVDTETFGPGGGGESEHAMSASAQARLWAMFEAWPEYVRDEHWPCHLGRGWTAIGREDALFQQCAETGAAHLVASTEVWPRRLRLVAVVRTRPCSTHDHHWSVWEGNLRYYLHWDRDPTRLEELNDVVWATVGTHKNLLVATSDASLRVLKVSDPESPNVELKVVQEHSLAGLTPKPGPSPAWARGSLRGSDR